MDTKTKLILAIKKVIQNNDYTFFNNFINEEGKKLKLLDDNNLQEYLYLIMKYSKHYNIDWLKNKTFIDKRIQQTIIKILLSKKVYSKIDISFQEIYEVIDIRSYPNNFYEKINELELLNSDILLISNIIYNKDKEKAKKILKKYNNRKYTYLEISKQIDQLTKKNQYDFIYDNFKYIVKQQQDLIEFYNMIKKDKRCVSKVTQYIVNNIDNLLNKDYETIIKYLDVFNKNSIIKKKIIEYIKNNYKIIVDNIKDNVDLYDMRNIFDEYKELRPLTKEYFKENKLKVIDHIYKSTNDLFMYYEDTGENLEKERNIIKTLLILIIDDICEKEKTKFEEIIKIGEGAFSSVYQIGNKVIKIGMDRRTRKIPNNPYIVKPLLRKAFLINDKKEDGEQLFIEITEKVQPYTEQIENIEEIMYTLYSKLREIGIEWLDVKPMNIGILLKDNYIHWPKVLSPSLKVLGIKESKYNKSKVLKKGSPVIVDADLLFAEEDFYKNYPDYDSRIKNGRFNSLWIKYHERYNKEHNITEPKKVYKKSRK